MSEQTSSELEEFREQWRAEVVARSKTTREQPSPRPRGAVHGQSIEASQNPVTRQPLISQSILEVEDEDHGPEAPEPKPYHDFDASNVYPLELNSVSRSTPEPQSALEHYEMAVEREDQGSLGDSLSHYRKAYRLDAKVDQTYKNKHFPPSSIPNPSNAAVTVPNPAHHSLNGPPETATTASQLIQSFDSLPITGTPPPVKGSPAPPCPIASIPSEVLIEILLRTATVDVAAYMRLSLVCKRLAYLVLSEDGIWKRICSGPEFGFAAMHYSFACSIEGTPLEPSEDSPHDPLILAQFSGLVLDPQTAVFPSVPSPSLATTPGYPTYIHMFHHRPRLRFGGVYISTVNYVRPGASSPTTISWNTPVHIVTYYRYLRFFRDGSCISLLTTAEPVDVVHHLLKEHLHTNHGGLPSNAMKHALRGRWRLSGPSLASSPSQPAGETTAHHLSKVHTLSSSDRTLEPEGNLCIETIGPDSKYTYHLSLALRSASNRPGATKNNKLVWRGFWSYNRLTDDWAEFGLRNDRAFFWSRVRSWGTG